MISRIRRRLDAMPLWAIALANLTVLGVWMVDIRTLDPLPYLDEVMIGAMLAGTSLYLWNRFFGPPTPVAADSRRRLAEVEDLYQSTKRAAGSLPAAASEIARLGSLLEKVRAIQVRIEQAEMVLASPQYSTTAAAAEIARLESEIANAHESARENLDGALAEAKKHADNIAHIRATRAALSAAFERIYQIIRRIHSQVLAFGLAQSGETELAGSVDELQKALEEQERERRAASSAETLLEKELEEARRRQQLGKTTP